MTRGQVPARCQGGEGSRERNTSAPSRVTETRPRGVDGGLALTDRLTGGGHVHLAPSCFCCCRRSNVSENLPRGLHLSALKTQGRPLPGPRGEKENLEEMATFKQRTGAAAAAEPALQREPVPGPGVCCRGLGGGAPSRGQGSWVLPELQPAHAARDVQSRAVSGLDTSLEGCCWALTLYIPPWMSACAKAQRQEDGTPPMGGQHARAGPFVSS